MNIKKAVILLQIVFCCSLFANEYSFRCEKNQIPAIAKGTYVCKWDNTLIYKTPNGKEIDFLTICPPNVGDSLIKQTGTFVCSPLKTLYGNDFYSFDDYGNLYFIVNTSAYRWVEYNLVIDRGTFLYKFDPVENTIQNWLIHEPSIPNSFCVSDDGKWAFLDAVEITDLYYETGFSKVFAIPMNNPENKKEIFISKQTKQNETRNRNICYDANTKCVYFYNYEDGLVILKPDSSGNYSLESLNPVSNIEYPACMVFANREGVWGLRESSEDSNKSKLFKIVDNTGNLKNPEENTLKEKVKGSWKIYPNIKVCTNFLLFISEDGASIYKYSNGRTRNVTKYASQKAEYNIDSLEEVAEILNKSDNPVFEIKLSEVQFVVLVLVLILFLVTIVILSVYIFYLLRKSSNIKKDKQFIYNIQEAERSKISRDIHDSIIQDIRAIRIETELLNVDQESERRKNKVIDLATDCVVKLRNICYNLTPAELSTHEEGDSAKIELVSIIQTLVLQFIERTHVPCSLKIDEGFEYPVLDKDVSQNLFRIIQEALNNIEKHSYATNCQILIKNKVEDGKKCMLIYISDDGVGCEVNQLLKRRNKFHFGVQNMKERAALIGADIQFQSEPGQGLEIRIKI